MGGVVVVVVVLLLLRLVVAVAVAEVTMIFVTAEVASFAHVGFVRGCLICFCAQLVHPHFFFVSSIF